MIYQGKGPLRGEITVPGDKSISHRSIMFGAIAAGDTRVRGFLESADCLSTISCFRSMEVDIERREDEIVIHGVSLHGLKEPEHVLDVGNSGTTTRLISGILAGQSFTSTLDGDDSIRTRPMKRIMDPLRQMGAGIRSLRDNNCVPLQIQKATDGLHAIAYRSPVSSAQVKSCVLLAGLYADDGETSVTEPALSRDHTERMLSGFGAEIRSEGLTCTIAPEPKLTGQDILVPGDISSAAYFIAAALLVPGSEILIRNVGINPTRAGILDVCKSMGADLAVAGTYSRGGEPSADLLVQSHALHGTVIEGDLIPTLIDELPVIAVMAAFADGDTVIRDAAELRVKESDRIRVMAEGLKAMGADVEELPDGMIIHGGKPLHSAEVETCLDHRAAMSFAVAALGAGVSLTIRDAECTRISYPDFFKDLDRLQ